MRKGLGNKKFLENNKVFDKDKFINVVIELGEEIGWFSDEIDNTGKFDKNYTKDEVDKLLDDISLIE